jgi:hypothetical protein
VIHGSKWFQVRGTQQYLTVMESFNSDSDSLVCLTTARSFVAAGTCVVRHCLALLSAVMSHVCNFSLQKKFASWYQILLQHLAEAIFIHGERLSASRTDSDLKDPPLLLL